MVLPADLFPRNVVGAVAGLVGFGGAMGGIAFGQLVGYLLDHGFGYGIVFTLAGTFHVIGLIVILVTIPVVRPYLRLSDFILRTLLEDYRNSHASRTMARQDHSFAAAFLHESDGFAGTSRIFHEYIYFSWLAGCRDLYGRWACRHRQCGTCASGYQTSH